MKALNNPTHFEIMEASLDIANPALGVSVVISEEKDRLWVNIDGVCILRIQGIKPGALDLQHPDHDD